ncbi:hypothetical protein E0I26_13830 [Flavobacterium rhamnosiphilum]|uniref:HEPN domain-containing protein n=1 Tax=Flavobacterium rhamnosiphilum TaxID=2541724 RepID=A0A4R5F3U8_9FLAO|nr:hypothetical protein [Flavobacterium rhamnosiphilum]TDE42228.1 hypothetical protein E0I26_13830 [Flavobacterium rhamnosiphilum]
MKTIDNVGLQTVKNIIVESISISGMYCFGKKKKIQSVLNPFSENSSKKDKHTHFYLLVLTNEYIINAVADISDIVKTKTEGRYTVTLLLHKAKSVHFLTPHQLYFYHEVLTKGYKVYEHENVLLNIDFNETPKRKVDYLRSYWKNRIKIAETFLRSENQIDYTDTGFVQESMMHIAVEQICLGLINVFLGYHPDHFSMAYLFDICEVFTPLTSDVFPRTTSEDKKLFDLLKAHPSALRWGSTKRSCLLDTELLEKRCNLFHERACELVEKELERLENLEPKKQ